MRLVRLDIAGFGCLRDLSVELHPRLTVLAGANESGKSTLHRAVRAALYGLDAGGQGRAVERSDWARWTPWTPGPYAVTLTYTLEDGRRLRVARRLDRREQEVQVLELGGSDLTDEVRRGRGVVPGAFHLGIDEAVFCATAWLGDDGLRLDGRDAASQRAASLQEAVERLADSRDGVTAREALARLQEAIDGIGTERRAASHLGLLSARLRELDRRLNDAVQRTQAVALEQERLRELERAAAAARRRRAEAEMGLLRGRLGVLELRRQRLGEVAHELDIERGEAAATAAYARFPLDLESRTATLAGQLLEADAACAETEARLAGTAARAEQARQRRAEVQAGIGALGDVAGDTAAAEAQARELTSRLATLAADAARVGSQDAAAKLGALRQEVARTGLGAMPAGSAATLAALLELRRRRPIPAAWMAAAAGAALAAAGGVVLLLHRGTAMLGAAAALAAVALSAATFLGLRRRRRDAVLAEAEAEALERSLGVSAGDIAPAATRVPALQALHDAIAVEEAAATERSAQAAALATAAAGLLQQAEQLAVSLGLAVAASAPALLTERCLQRAGELLHRIDGAIDLRRRRRELTAELASLEAELQAHHVLDEQARSRRQAVRALQSQLHHLLSGTGCEDMRLEAALGAVRLACDARRRHDAAVAKAAALEQQRASLGDPEAVLRGVRQLRDDLSRLGGDAQDLSAPAEGELQRLERESRHAQQAEQAASAQAGELRARLDGLLDGMPNLADLQDERDACAAARDRALHQLAALRRAAELIQTASRTTHRDLAPLLSEQIARHLGALTDSRYSAVNVDTDRFTVRLLGRERPDMVSLELVSHGTRDQVALLLRLALCQVLGGSGEPVPLLLDEPLLTADPARRELLLTFLHSLSETNQVLVSTADPALVDAVVARCGDDCSVIELAAAAAARRPAALVV